MRRILLTLVPKLLLSRTVRLLAGIPVPRFLRRPLYGSYARFYGADLDEAEQEVSEFRSFAEFFRRRLGQGRRPIDSTATYVWPCDGTLSSSGPIRDGRLPQVKGRSYGLRELLNGTEDEARLYEGGSQATIYLAPGDYHRVHAPFDAELIQITPLPGGLFPVNPQTARVIPELFPRNERTVFRFRFAGGDQAAVVMVAALNVSDIRRSASAGEKLLRGAELGVFGLGSTTVMLLPPGREAFSLDESNPTVRMGARVRSNGNPV